MLIYKITNKLENKHYIGQTKNKIDARLRQHCRVGMRGDNRRLAEAILHYGLINMSIEILEEVEDSRARDVETSYMKEYNTLWPNGYNMKLEEARDKLVLSEEDKLQKERNLKDGLPWNKNINTTKYIGDKISLALEEKRKNGWENPSLGHSHTPETREKISSIKKNYYKTNTAHNAKEWRITDENGTRVTNTLCRDLGKKMYNRICAWSRNNPNKIHPKLKMRVDHV